MVLPNRGDLGTATLELTTDSSKLDAGLKRGRSSIGAFGKLAVLGAAAGAAAIAGIGVAAIKMAADFDKSMREVNTLLNLSEEAFGALKADVLSLSQEIGIAAGEMVPALYQAISAGVPKENVMTFLETAGKLAIGGVTTLETAVDGLTTAINAFQIPMEEAESVSDTFFVGVKAGKTTVEELSKALFQVAPMASAAGAGLQETVAATAALTTAGVPTRVATTQIRAAIQGLLRPADEVIAVFNQAGFASGQLAVKELGLAGAFQIMADAAEGDIGVLTRMVGSIEGVAAILSLTGAQAGVFASTLDEMRSTSGQANLAFEEMNKSVARQWDLLKNKFSTTMIRIGGKLLPLVIRMLTLMTPLIDLATVALEQLFDFLINVVERAVVIFEPLFGSIMRRFNELRGVGNVLSGMFRTMFGAAEEGAASFERGMTGTFDTVSESLDDFAERFGQRLGQIGTDLEEDGEGAGAAVGEAIGTGLVDAFESEEQRISEAAGEMVMQINEALESGFEDVLVDTVHPAMEEFEKALAGPPKNAIEQLTENLRSYRGTFTKGWQETSRTIGQMLVKSTADLAGWVVKAIPGMVSGMFKFTQDLIMLLDQVLKAVLSIGFQIGVGLVQGIIDGIASLWNSLVGWLNRLGEATGSRTGIPGFGDGREGEEVGAQFGARVLRSGIVRVGEAGPERVFLPRGATVAPLPRGGAGGGGGSVILNGPLVGSVMVTNEADEDRLVAKLRDMMEVDLRRALTQDSRFPFGFMRSA